MVPDRGLMDRQLAGVKGKKDRLTYASHHKCGWLREAPTVHHWEGEETPAHSKRRRVKNWAFIIETMQQPG